MYVALISSLYFFCDNFAHFMILSYYDGLVCVSKISLS